MSCAVCGTSTTRRTRLEIECLDSDLYAITREHRPATVRQIFYQAVVLGLVPKCETHGYRVVQRRLLVLREARIVPYGWIADNARMVRTRASWRNPEAFAKEAASRYRRDYWADSDVRVEVWMEKDALAGVLYPVVVEEFGLDLYVTRGFSSVTYLHEAAEAIRADGRTTYVYLLTDFDPSGISIADSVERELRRRARLHADDFPPDDPDGAWLRRELPEGLGLVDVERLAVSREQIDGYGLPTRPTKTTDTRSRAFMAQYGTGSVELDAIPPDVLRQLVRGAIEQHMDRRKLAQLKMVEQEEREGLQRLLGEAV